MTESGPPASTVRASEEQTLAGDAAVRTDDRPLARGDAIGRYLVVDRIGQGAMGQVFRAYDPDLDRPVAIKVLRHGAHDPRSTLAEAKAMARIDHPHVIRVYDAGVHEGSVFVTMELVDGPTLDRWLVTEHSRDELLDVIMGAARGLAAAHDAGVIHRDFKPANIMIADGRHAKVGDFGLAGFDGGQAESDDDGDTFRSAIGTPAYMSPEHLAGEGIDARSDQFSFGIVLHEALHGERPFAGDSLAQLAGEVLEGRVPASLRERKRPFDGLLLRALDPDPERRFESMPALIAEVERIRRPSRRGWVLAGAAGLALVVAAVSTREAPAPCEQGAQLVEAFWNDEARAKVKLGGTDYTEAFVLDTRERFARALDDYAERWSAAHDASCSEVGPLGARGTPAQQATARCLGNRLHTMEGLVELTTSAAVDASRASILARSLPSLEECRTGGWKPYPSDPDQADQVAELYEQLMALRTARMADHHEGLAPRLEQLIEQARDLEQPYLVADALREHGRLMAISHDVEGARRSLEEALETALAAGHDHLAAVIANDFLLNLDLHPGVTWREASHLAALGRGLNARTGRADEQLLGNIELNLGGQLRILGRFEEALEHDVRAAESFERAGDLIGVARARLNRLTSLGNLARYDEFERDIYEVIDQLTQLEGPSSPNTIIARTNIVWLLYTTGRPRDAHPIAVELMRDVRAHYAPSSATYRAAVRTQAFIALLVGRLDEAEGLVRELDSLTPAQGAARLDTNILIAKLHLYRGDSQPSMLRDIEKLAVALGDDYYRWLARMEHAQLLWLAGDVDGARSILEDSDLLRAVAEVRPDDLRAVYVFSCAIAQLDPQLDEPIDRTANTALSSAAARWRLDVAQAIQQGDLASVQRLRDQHLRSFSATDPDVRTIDAWLARRAAPAPE